MGWLKIASTLVTLISNVIALIRSERERRAGYTQAVQEALQLAAERVKVANEARAEGDRRHAVDGTDDSLLRTFERKEP